jgi:acetyl/propionyl-CoA carboxylase alpha subunit
VFKKILIANRGEIAVRIIRTCQDMGIETVALYSPSDRTSLHVRIADEAVSLDSPLGFMDADAILAVARDRSVDAIHPGYGFLAEEAPFIRACEAAGIAFIGPSSQIIGAVRDKLSALERARAAGFRTVEHSPRAFDEGEVDAVRHAAEAIGYPLVIKSTSGGRGRGERLVFSPEHFEESLRAAQSEAAVVYGSSAVYVERAIMPVHQVSVQIAADVHGNLVCLGEREGSIMSGNQKLLEESPAPCLSDQRPALWNAALELARLFGYRNVGSVEFLVDTHGDFYFTEFKARIQVDHPISESITRIDLVREQIRIAAGMPLSVTQEQVELRGCAMMCRISAQDPLRRYLPSPGALQSVRLPGGLQVRVDTYVYDGCTVPGDYDPLIAKITVWGDTRDVCLKRLCRALEEFQVTGIPTNVPLLQAVANTSTFVEGCYTTDFLHEPLEEVALPEDYTRDLAVAAAVLYARRHQTFRPSTPERLSSGWHRDSRRLPQ